jgi:hypothetical protein
MGTTMSVGAVALTPAEIEVIGEPELTIAEIGDLIENQRARFDGLEAQLFALIEAVNTIGAMQNQVNEMVQGFLTQASAAMSSGGVGNMLKMVMGKGASNG